MENDHAEEVIAASNVEGEGGKKADRPARERLFQVVHGLGSIGNFTAAIVLVIAALIAAAQWRISSEQLKVMELEMRGSDLNARKTEKATGKIIENADSLALQLRLLADSARQQLQISKGQAVALEKQVASLSAQAIELKSQAASASRQADAMSDQAQSVRDQAVSMKNLADADKVIAEATNVGVEASKSVASTSARQLEITDRPWLRVSLSITRLDFMMFARSGHAMQTAVDESVAEWPTHAVNFRTQATLTNSGHSVANNVHIRVRILLVGPAEEGSPDGSLNGAAAAVCSSTSAGSRGGKTIFPNDDVREYVHDSSMIRPEDIHEPALPLFKAPSIHLAVAGCITYTFANSLLPHKTWFTYRIARANPRKRDAMRAFDFDLGSTPPTNSLSLEEVENGSGAD